MRNLMLSALLLSSPLVEAFEENVNTAAPKEIESTHAAFKDPNKNPEKKTKKDKNAPTTVINNVSGITTYITATANQDSNSQVVDYLDPITFNTTTVNNGPITNNGAGVFTAAEAGIYEVTFGAKWISPDPDSMIALQVNGAVLEASRITSSQHGSSFSIIVDASTTRNTTFAIVNDSFVAPSSPITLAGDTAGHTSSAFITIKKIN